MPLIETTGAASSRGFGQFARSVAANYIEDVFQTWLYTGNGSTQTITNGIDLAGKGGMVWGKGRSIANDNCLFDTARGATKRLFSNNTDSENTSATSLTSFNSNGFSLGDNAAINASGNTFVSWTFRKQPKFFDVVTYTGNGVDDRQIPHSLGSKPGCVIIKRTDTTGDWAVSHRYDFGNVLFLNTTAAAIANPSSNSYFGYPVDPLQSTYFTVGTNAATNANGGTYVAYLFAHDAGGFGASGTDNVISCGSFTSDTGGFATINLGYEPQWILVKSSDAATGWFLIDNMRGFTAVPGSSQYVLANSANADNATLDYNVTSTGFQYGGASGGATSRSFIYIAIRRGPMRTPTTGTSVYSGITRTGTGANATVTGTGFPVDLLFSGSRNAAFGTIDFDRLRGATQRLFTYSTAAEAARSTSLTSFAVQDGYTIGDDATDGGLNNNGQTYIYWNFRRAPGFFDVVCYTGTGGTRIQNHNLGVAPELIIQKSRSVSGGWPVYSSPTGFSLGGNLSATNQFGGGNATISATSASTYTTSVNDSGTTYVAYLFATVAGVSKVGSYTGTGTTLQINCGFTGGARFVLIKRTDSTGDWYVWDSARGIVAGNDPYLLLNSTAAEVTSTDYVDTFSSGFEISSTAPAAINANGGTFIFLAIA